MRDMIGAEIRVFANKYIVYKDFIRFVVAKYTFRLIRAHVDFFLSPVY